MVQKWVDLATEFKTSIDGVKQACADIPANGWVALQGKSTENKLPEYEPDFCVTNCLVDEPNGNTTTSN